MTIAPRTNPRLSIVIAAWNGPAALRECLESLRTQAETPNTEIIVAANFAAATDVCQATAVSNLKTLTLPAGATVPALRAAGIAAARGEIVALTEDHCVIGSNWCAEIKKAHELDYSIVGGPVENGGGQRAVDWAVYFYDYGRYMPPTTSGETASLSGINVSYKRAALEEVQDVYREGFFEVFVHQELSRRGHRLYMASSAVVYHNKSYAFGPAFAQCFHLARSFAGQRLAGARLPKRLAYAIGSLFLPILLPARIVLQTVRKKRRLSKLCLAFPSLVALMASWSCGEFCGYLFGEGESTAKWK